MDDDSRDALAEQLESYDRAIEALEALRRPYDQIIGLLSEGKELLLERCAAEVAGKCEHCSALLLAGDRGHPGGEDHGPYCEVCAPTWYDIKRNNQEALDNDLGDPDDARAAIEAFEAHIAAGGKPDDKPLYKLEGGGW